MLLYFFIFYNDTYNLIRQYLAIAIVFANIDKLEERKYKKFLVWVIVAALVHATAIICIGLIIMHYFVTSGRLENKVIRKFILVLGVMLVCLFFSQIIEILVQTGLLSSKYLYYIKHESVSDNNLASILYLSELILCIIYSKRLKTIMGNADFYVMNAYVLFVLLQLSRVIFYGNRISLFFAMPNLLLLSFLPKLENTGVKRLAVSSTICILGFGYWWYLYVYGGVSQTYPYMLGV
jgi:hypothetical protein